MSVVQTVLPKEAKQALEQLASNDRRSTSQLGSIFIAKGMRSAIGEQAEPQAMVDSGLCPNIEEAEKLLKFLEAH